MELQVLDRVHLDALLAFERESRAWFAASIPDRGDAYFAEFAERLDALLADQAAGELAFHVLVDDDGAIIGRFNLVDLEDGTADVGYRVAEAVAGRGIATAMLRELCLRARQEYGLTTLTAATTHDNVASRKVLLRAGFTEVGPADPSKIGGGSGPAFRRDLDDL